MQAFFGNSKQKPTRHVIRKCPDASIICDQNAYTALYTCLPSKAFVRSSEADVGQTRVFCLFSRATPPEGIAKHPRAGTFQAEATLKLDTNRAADDAWQEEMRRAGGPTCGIVRAASYVRWADAAAAFNAGESAE